jgi:hypothetical protein
MYDDEFRRMYPDTSFPQVLTVELLNDYGADPVFEGPQPPLTENQWSKYDGVEQIDGKWYTKYIAVDYTPEEIAQRLEQWRQGASCTPFQGRMALSDAGLLAQAQAAVDASDEKTKVAWEYALVWNRTSPMIEALGTALGLTDVQIDNLFKEAQKIQA